MDTWETSSAYESICSRLKQPGWALISGVGGSGKSALAHCVANCYQKERHNIIFVSDLTVFDYTNVLQTKEPTLMILEDAFGTDDIISLQTLQNINRLETFANDIMAIALNNEQNPHNKRLNKGEMMCKFLFTSNSSHFRNALMIMPRLQYTFFKENTVVDITNKCSQSEKERQLIAQGYCKEGTIQNISTQCGFPLANELLKRFKSFQENVNYFLENPIKSLCEKLQEMMQSRDNMTVILILLVLNEGTISLNDLIANGKQSSGKLQNELNLIASHTDIAIEGIEKYITKEAFLTEETLFAIRPNEISLVSTSVFKLLVYSVGKYYPGLFVELCPITIITNMLKLCKDNDHHYLNIEDLPFDSLIQRIAKEISDNNFQGTLESEIWKNEMVVENVIRELQRYNAFVELLHSRDQTTGLHFLFWAALCPSTRLLEEALEREYFASDEKMEGIVACCLCGKKEALDMLLYGGLLDSTISSPYKVPRVEQRPTNQHMLGLFTGTHDKPIHLACKYGHIGILLRILREKHSIESRGSELRSPLLTAVHYAHTTLAEALIKRDANVSVVDAKGQNCLHIASQLGLQELVHVLLIENIDINLTDNNNNTPLHLAFNSENFTIVQKLLEHETDINVRGQQMRTPLMEASHNGLIDLVTFLLKKGADIHLTDEYGNNSLIIACMQGHQDVVHKLIQSGLNIHNIGQQQTSPVMAAVLSGSNNLVKYFLKEGANVFQNNADGQNCLTLACMKGYTDIAITLIEHGMDVNDDSQKPSPLLCACLSESSKLVDTLLDEGADLSFTDINTNDCLLLASKGSNVDIVQRFLQHGVKVTSENKWQWTPLMVASQSGSDQLVKLLLKNGADIHVEGPNSLVIACLHGHITIVKILLEHCVDVDCQSSWQQNPLDAACQSQSRNIIELLFEKGVKTNQRDYNGSNCLVAACERGHTDVVMLLLQLGLDINSRGRQGQTPLIAAVYSSKIELVQKLISHGADKELTNDAGDNCLTIACSLGLKDVTVLLINNGFSINCRGSDQKTPLMFACSSSAVDFKEYLLLRGENLCEFAQYLDQIGAGSIDLVEFLILRGANITLTDKEGNNCLMLACAKGYLDIVFHLVQYGMNLNETKHDGFTPLMAACASGSMSLIEFLLENEADSFCKDTKGDNCLIVACRHQHSDVVTKMIKAGIKVNWCNAIKQTPLMAAVSSNSHNIVDILLQAGADPHLEDENSSNCLFLACEEINVKMVAKLLEFGMDVNGRGRECQTPLMVACAHGNTELVQILLEYNANMYLLDKYGFHCFNMARRNQHEGMSIMKELLKNGFEINTQNASKQTPLLEASIAGAVDILEELVNIGADIDQRDEDNNNALILASSHGQLEIVAKLLEYGQDVNCKGKWEVTPLISASMSGADNLVEMLLVNGADMNTLDESGNNALIAACAKGRHKSVEKLMQYGADVNRKGRYQWSPLLAACWNGSTDIVDYLLCNGARLDMTHGDDVKCITLSILQGHGEVAGRLLEHLLSQM